MASPPTQPPPTTVNERGEQQGGGGGGWGATNMPAQVLITVPPVETQGIPTDGGWDQGLGWDDGASGEWIDTDNLPGGLTDADIYAAINATKPTGVIAWVDIQ